MGRTLYEKVYDAHVVNELSGELPLLYIDRHLLHEVTSPQAFSGLREAGRKLRRPDLMLATMDHDISTQKATLDVCSPKAREQVTTLIRNCREFGVTLFGLGHPGQGIVHIVGPQTGFTLPGTTLVCGDSHTATHGAFGALAFGIGTSEVEHVMATQTLKQQRFKTMRIVCDGVLPKGVYAKDLILAIAARITTAGGTGYAIEFAGTGVEALSMEGRMTLSNMAIEVGAKVGMIAPDETTFAYLKGRPFAPKGEAWDAAVEYWCTLRSDDDAVFDKEVHIDCSSLEPHVTWGTNPGQAMPVTGMVPVPAEMADPVERAGAEAALAYIGVEPGAPVTDAKVDTVFIGSCTNGLPRGGQSTEGPQGGRRRSRLGRAGLHGRARRGRGRGARPDLHRGRVRMEAYGLLDVPCHERRPCHRGLARRLHLQPQLRRPPGTRQPHPSDEPRIGRRRSRCRPHRRRPRLHLRRHAEMEKFTTLTGVAAPLDAANVDTDQIIPKQFLLAVDRKGFGVHLFHERRYLDDAETIENPDFVLNKPAYRSASILVARRNFGNGSSREHAPWTLLDFGIRAIIAPSFADIFSNNALGNGLVLVNLAEEEVDELFRILEADPGMKVTVDLVTMTCTAGERTWRFTLDPFRRKCLLEGLDAVSLTLEHEDDIRAREKREPAWLVPHVEDLKSCPV